MKEDLDKLSSDLRKQLQGLESLERLLDSAYGGLEPPAGAVEQLLGQLAGAVAESESAFSEADLMLDQAADTGPINFEQAVARMQSEDTDDHGSDLLAAGLEEEPVQPEDSTAGRSSGEGEDPEDRNDSDSN